MAENHYDETIAAVATPIGEGAIAVVRVSGKNAITAIDGIFKGSTKVSEAASFSIHLGKLYNLSDEFVDDVMVSVFRSPRSYTGEDTVEISCHGGLFVTQKVFEAILSTGVRQAEPGEFTKRAFLNGKMDLSQAEAVADLIAAKSESSLRVSVRQLEGRFSTEIKILRSELLNLRSLLEIELDFSEEGIPLVSNSELLKKIKDPRCRIKSMIDTYETGRRYRNGISVAIIGKPNAGKSSLFNALLAEDRAIVSEIAGTTRDFLEESIVIKGVLFRLNDTAGLRDSIDRVEIDGVSRSRRLMKQSDMILFVIDMSDGGSMEVGELDEFSATKIIVFNKSDLVNEHERNTFSGLSRDSVLVSARNGEGLENLRNNMFSVLFSNSSIHADELEVTSLRHLTLLESAHTSLVAAEGLAMNGISNELIPIDIQGACKALSEIVGDISSEDTLNNIFSHFCIGK